MLSILTDVWGNASSQHAVGQQAKGTLAAARATIARALDCKPAELIFASAGTASARHQLPALRRASRRGRVAAVRLSLGEITTAQDIEYVLAHLPPLLRPLLEEAAHPA
ncbi:cysteine sulfinate desulfinase/cysteine desulfurase-like protein [Paraburkholderia sp. CI2]|uniref:hypothetical protein n=1 Tax=Paraburkholderia sp. CI2 TaxID=2723093 RepID=UPI001831C7B7|nr:hypothetical protein [Paraburkholderia sp. CI2]MBB5469659.1 cysteine sulfinate desulfinase/cysteine desulfurase-like protein [Paraburkholderia sp. CI2]